MMKSLQTSLKKHVWDVILPRWSAIFLIAFILAMFSNVIVRTDEKMDITPTSDIQFLLFLILTQIIFIITTHTMHFFNTPEQKKEFSFKLMIAACVALILMLMISIFVMFSDHMLKLVGGLLGTECSRSETLSSIGYGMGGVLAVIGASAINRRANADVENNRLIEKGHIHDRFVTAMKDLSSSNKQKRKFSFYQFYYLAKENQEKVFQWDIFDILCEQLRKVSRSLSDLKETKKTNNRYSDAATRDGDAIYDLVLFRQIIDRESACNNVIQDLLNERHTLLSILFRKYFEIYMFGEHKAELWGAYLVGASLKEASLVKAELQSACISGANLERANLLGANLENANFSGEEHWNQEKWDKETLHFRNKGLDAIKNMGVNLKGANLKGAYLKNANLSYADLSDADLSGKESWNAKKWRKGTLPFTNERLDNLRRMSANLDGADLSNAILRRAQLESVDFQNVRCLEGTDFSGATISTGPITKDNLPSDKGTYILNTLEEKS